MEIGIEDFGLFGWIKLSNILNFVSLLDDSSKAASDELSDIDGVPCGQVIEVVVPAWDLQGNIKSLNLHEDETNLIRWMSKNNRPCKSVDEIIIKHYRFFVLHKNNIT